MREYEQNNLQREKEKELHALELKTQLDKISAKLKFEDARTRTLTPTLSPTLAQPQPYS